ncbi:hypothetical protein [Shewanella sp. MBTL60-007]|uniref:hypothetical protein n=1 Tax=Shewanella sp. MBTL60-007 TaxID=2815911 RepID=UPI001BC687FC|nr:hypothetical protein [Shewanella sp. MBTL60-007]GIU22263.1 hypothetical protein TUM3792_24180 [Shewanella sp. MBTL60-007]
MIKFMRHSTLGMAAANRGKLELDLDPLSERHIVTDRKTGETLFIGNNDIKIHYFDGKYAIDGNLVVTILDDNREYNAAVVDGVKCEAVDLVQTPA